MKTFLFYTFVLFFIVSNSQTPGYVPINGLKGWWPFTGNANDVHTNAYNGTSNGATLSQDRFNNNNCAYSFNGVNNYISTNWAGILGANPRAVSFWAKTTFSTTMMTAVAWGDNAQATRFNCMFNYVASGPTADGGNGAITYSAANVYNGNWHHFVYQFGTPILNQFNIYMDGALLTNTLHAFNPNNSLNTVSNFNVLFGRIVYAGGDLFFNGSLDDIGIWDRTLSHCEIQELFYASHTSISVTANSSVICRGQAIGLTASGASTYTWNTNSNLPTISVSPSVTTVYSVAGTNTLTGCTATNTITINVVDCTSLPENTVYDFVNIYPNPNSGVFTIHFDRQGEKEIEVTDIVGRKVKEMETENSNLQVDLTDLKKGIYFVKVRSGLKEQMQKVIID